MLLSSFKTISLVFQKKRKKYFQDDSHGGHVGFPIGTVLAMMLPTKIQVIKCFGLIFKMAATAASLAFRSERF